MRITRASGSLVARASLLVSLGASLGAGCYRGGPATPAPITSTPTSTASKARPRMSIGVSSLGPITATTPANAAALTALLAHDGYTVRPVDRNGVEFHVFLGEELLFYVIPNDDGSLFNVHAVSSKIGITEHPQWMIGAPFSGDAMLTNCECWGSQPVCYRAGDHVAVAFERSCDGLSDARERRVLAGVRIQRAIWSPQPFAGTDDHADDPGLPDPCGGP